jgi:catechol 2,3-dioxygenase-like lactoylglutathione lyase family enzyme
LAIEIRNARNFRRDIAMPLTQLEHYLVLTDDLELTRDFYHLALGMRIGPRPPLEYPGYWLYVGDVPCIHIAEWESYRAHSTEAGVSVSTRAPGTGPVDHIAFNGIDCEAIKSTLIAHGVEFAVNEVPGIGLTQLFLHDPNGVKVEINVRAAVTRRPRRRAGAAEPRPHVVPLRSD